MEKYDGNLLMAPCPTVLVTSKFENIENVLTISWAGIASSHPEYVSVSINKKRYSHEIISRSRKYCINIPSNELIHCVDYCGSVSGRMVDKFDKCRFNKKTINDYVLIEQCRLSVLCDVEYIIDLGSHTLFVAKVVEKYSNFECGECFCDYVKPIAYCRPYYHKIESSPLGWYGFSVNKD